jgi:hypothetical protein
MRVGQGVRDKGLNRVMDSLIDGVSHKVELYQRFLEEEGEGFGDLNRDMHLKALSLNPLEVGNYSEIVALYVSVIRDDRYDKLVVSEVTKIFNAAQKARDGDVPRGVESAFSDFADSLVKKS